jgi:hypothetical protein
MPVLDPTRMRFSQHARRQLDDDDNRGLNCRGCLFHKQKIAVCKVANQVAVENLGLRDCDAVDPFGEVVIYVPYREVQRDIFGEQEHALESTEPV